MKTSSADFIFSFLRMPNKMQNSLVIEAPFDEVVDYFVSGHCCVMHESEEHCFNLHKILPEHIAATDPTGCSGYSYETMMRLLGVRSNPAVSIEAGKQACQVTFETAWEPSLMLTQRLHDATGWVMVHRFYDPMSYSGAMVCEG